MDVKKHINVTIVISLIINHHNHSFGIEYKYIALMVLTCSGRKRKSSDLEYGDILKREHSALQARRKKKLSAQKDQYLFEDPLDQRDSDSSLESGVAHLEVTDYDLTSMIAHSSNSRDTLHSCSESITTNVSIDNCGVPPHLQKATIDLFNKFQSLEDGTFGLLPGEPVTTEHAQRIKKAREAELVERHQRVDEVRRNSATGPQPNGRSHRYLEGGMSPHHFHSNSHGWRFKNMRCLLYPLQQVKPYESNKLLEFMAGADSSNGSEECEFQDITDNNHKIYNQFEINLFERPDFEQILKDICYNKMSPYNLVCLFGISHIFQPYIEVATWPEFEEFFCGGILNATVNALLDSLDHHV